MESRPYRLSVVIPLLDEEDSLSELHRRLRAALEPWAPVQLVFVDDGSRDRSFQVIEQLIAADPDIVALRFRRNFGKSHALNEGFKHATGTYVATIDADLQDEPEEIPRMLEILEESDAYDLVSGWKWPRRDGFIKRWTSRFFNFVVRRTSGIALHDFNNGLKVYRREVLQELVLYGELHRYIPVLAGQLGFRSTELKVRHHARKHGVTKFGPARFLNGFLDLLTVKFLSSYRNRPLHIFGRLAVLLGGLGAGIVLWFLVAWYLNDFQLTLRPLMVGGMFSVIVGLQCLFFGLLAEMTAHRLALEQRGHKVSVREIVRGASYDAPSPAAEPAPEAEEQSPEESESETSAV